MKICYLANANSSHTKKWCESFVKKGYEVSVISLSDGVIDNVRVYSLDIDSNNITKKNDLFKLNYLKKIAMVRKLVREIKPDILHAHYATSYGLLGSLASYSPLVLSVWGSDVYDFPNKSPIHRKLLKYNLAKADVVMSTSNCMAKEVSKYTDKDIFVTPFGVDINKFKVKLKERNENEIVIGTVKSLEKIYGIDILIKAFSIVKSKVNDKNIKLKIAGKGTLEKELKELVASLNLSNEVEFLGFLSEDDVISTFQSLDIAVFPSISESFGVAAIEAEACGIPTVISNEEGLMEATNPNKSSLVVKKSNIEELAEAIIKLINDASLRENMGRAGREYVENNYNIINNFNYVEEIYKQVNMK
ncbi:glycosyltransferase family 4 protein [Clostridium sp. 'White wine YQ']|uniref:glycosyltransferase family 4 protein n=1 Tax=Clostridium sp. 'White wine YQ' TaxID=3027474 RepID=UPI002365528E|nr:glycosyltransferase family 4 protein [Clostridium sp. 'White wine YQ']MDD7794972.1 glycosyltransferase family 4 protein [Clostridium sp. 'White wine YQ']